MYVWRPMYTCRHKYDIQTSNNERLIEIRVVDEKPIIHDVVVYYR